MKTKVLTILLLATLLVSGCVQEPSPLPTSSQGIGNDLDTQYTEYRRKRREIDYKYLVLHYQALTNGNATSDVLAERHREQSVLHKEYEQVLERMERKLKQEDARFKLEHLKQFKERLDKKKQ